MTAGISAAMLRSMNSAIWFSTWRNCPPRRVAASEKVITGSFYGSCSPQVDMPIVLDLYMDGRLPLDRLISREYPLEEINEAFAAMNAGEVARTVIRP